MFAEIIVH